MSKEIYKEYLCEWVDAYSLEARLKVNSKYTCNGVDLMIREASLICMAGDYESFTRKPKTQMINGHEVVAPCYDAPTDSCNVVYLIFPLGNCGYRSCNWESLAMTARDALMINGYYTSKEDVSAFIKAHRDNKND